MCIIWSSFYAAPSLFVGSQYFFISFVYSYRKRWTRLVGTIDYVWLRVRGGTFTVFLAVYNTTTYLNIFNSCMLLCII